MGLSFRVDLFRQEKTAMRIAKEGLALIFASIAFVVAFLAFRWWLPAVLFFLFAAAFAFFFRDPKRVPPVGEHLLVSPADGRVMSVEAVDAAPGIDGPGNRIAIFLSLLDVHIVRSPLAASVGSVEYRPGKFLPAYKPEASAANESNTIVFEGGPTPLVLKMMVGVAARRIKCFVKARAAVARGQKIGLMYFGSRVEITLPRNVAIKTGLNRKVRAGESVIAEVQS
jgi:phosphatidylserine decarboxylase